MAEKKKTEVNLEVCSGFFRIPTDNLIFNITVLESRVSSTTRVVEKIIEAEKEVSAAPQDSPPLPQPPKKIQVPATPSPAQPTDDFYKKTVEKVAADLKQLSDSLGDKIGGDQAPEGVEDLATMTTDLQNVLTSAKKLSVGGSGSSGEPSSALINELAQKLDQAQKLAGDGGDDATGDNEAPTAAATQKVTRHLFDLDAAFQTMYELCTNETVKTHIQNARGKAEELFNKNTFYDAISPMVSNYDNDDGFFNIPMTDLYQSLTKATTDKAVTNLLKKMDQQQSEIFLDQFLPLEIPPTEEVEIAAEDVGTGAPTEERATPPASGDSELAVILSECQGLVNKALTGTGADEAPASDNGDSELTDVINDAITITGSLLDDATLLAESCSLDGGDNFENTLWYKIKKTSTFYTAMLDKKSEQSGLSFDDGLTAGNESTQVLKDQIKEKIEASKPKEPEPSSDEISEEDSQCDIEKLLEEMGD